MPHTQQIDGLFNGLHRLDTGSARASIREAGPLKRADSYVLSADGTKT
jgi:hypothetical protein